jgi:hypothetical protein
MPTLLASSGNVGLSRVFASARMEGDKFNLAAVPD